MVISKDEENNCLNYNCQSSIPETKNMLSAVQRSVHRELANLKVVREEEVLKVITRHFKKEADIFRFLMEFTHASGTPLEFLRIENIQAGLTKKRVPCPDKFKWLEDQVDEITLRGTNLESSDIIELGKLGILVFGEFDACYQFDVDSVTGTCVVKYGFPSFFNHGKLATEFEARIQNVTPNAGFEGVSREKLRADITAYFMAWKSTIFDRYINEKIVDINLRDDDLQYRLSVETKEQ